MSLENIFDICFIIFLVLLLIDQIRNRKSRKDKEKRLNDAIRDGLKAAQVTVIKEAYLTIDDKDIAAQISDAICKHITERRGAENFVAEPDKTVNAG